MRVMTGDTRCGPRFDLLMGGKKFRGALVMALRAEGSHCLQSQGRLVGSMGTVAGCTILGSGGMRRPLLPELGDVAMTAEAKRRLPFLHKTGVG